MEGSSHFVPASVIAVSVLASILVQESGGLRELVTCVLPADDGRRGDVLALQQRLRITHGVTCGLPGVRKEL